MTRSIPAASVPSGVADRGLARAAAGFVLASFTGHTAPRWVLDGLADGLAGVVLFGSNIVDPEQLTRLCTTLRSAGDDPVVAIDEEGGDVTRLAHATGSPYPGNAALGAADDVVLTRQVYRALGAELAAVGVTLDLAPSVDVNTAADNPIIGTRAFGDDPHLVARHGVAAVTGLHDAGVAACVKHFPGHGATSEDSHLALPTVDVSLDALRTLELVPFRAAIAAGAQCVMTAHIRVPALTGELPATLSSAALHTLLRTELGFPGVVVTDALDMHAASARA
ncbi:MAG TPA: glycoside hydrolase family 3 N-terminal domain-containing protein, partial [Pseudonocardia sp.]|nr:glycoside hydrolase family 3 N-terminal domain-containing protein [Pseudonocardia sp.]